MLPPDFTSKGPTPCSQVNPEDFFPELEVTGSLSRANAAKKLCFTCPYQTECLEWALSRNDPGVWGGTSENERRKIRRDRAAAKAQRKGMTTYV